MWCCVCVLFWTGLPVPGPGAFAKRKIYVFPNKIQDILNPIHSFIKVVSLGCLWVYSWFCLSLVTVAMSHKFKLFQLFTVLGNIIAL